MREKDGLALSSRNVYLAEDERRAAPVLHRTMKDVAAKLRAGAELEPTLADGREPIAAAGFAIDYFEARNAETLAPITSIKNGPVRLLVAAKIGRTRLIDNIGAWVPSQQPEIAQFAAHRLRHRRHAGGRGLA